MLEFDLVKIFRRFFNTKDEITSKLNQKSNVNHSHGNINNEGKLASANGILVTDDDKNIIVSDTISRSKIGDFGHSHSKSEITDSHSKSEITDFPTSMVPSAHTHNKNEITNFNHSHMRADISNFNHEHVKFDITDFSHSHSKSEITDFNHNHSKSDITDLFNYDISVSKATVNAGTSESTTISVKVTNQSNNPVPNHNVTIYKNNVSYHTGKTNSDGVISISYAPRGTADVGIVVFSVLNQKAEVYVKYDTGWVDITDIHKAIFVMDHPTLQVRRIGDLVRIRGAAKSKTTFPLIDFNDMTNVVSLPDERFYPVYTENFVIPSSKKQRALLQVKNNGAVVVGRFTDSNASGEYTIPNNLWIPIHVDYFVG